MIKHASRDIMHNMNTQEELIKLKESTGLNWRKFSEYYEIPYRTVQDWYMGKRKMPEYLLKLMIYKAEIERIQINKNDDVTRLESLGAFDQLRKAVADTPEMSAEEIDEEIAAARAERRYGEIL